MSKIEELRQKISDLKKELENATLEKGLAAEDNKDLRENFAYDYWEQKERLCVSRIHSIMQELRELIGSNTNNVKKKVKKSTQNAKDPLFQKHKWL